MFNNRIPKSSQLWVSSKRHPRVFKRKAGSRALPYRTGQRDKGVINISARTEDFNKLIMRPEAFSKVLMINLRFFIYVALSIDNNNMSSTKRRCDICTKLFLNTYPLMIPLLRASSIRLDRQSMAMTNKNGDRGSSYLIPLVA